MATVSDFYGFRIDSLEEWVEDYCMGYIGFRCRLLYKEWSLGPVRDDGRGGCYSYAFNQLPLAVKVLEAAPELADHTVVCEDGYTEALDYIVAILVDRACGTDDGMGAGRDLELDAEAMEIDRLMGKWGLR